MRLPLRGHLTISAGTDIEAKSFISTGKVMMAELTDQSNQAKAFAMLGELFLVRE